MYRLIVSLLSFLVVFALFVPHSASALGTKTVAITLQTLDSGEDIMTDASDDFLVLHLYASWCGYCRAEYPLWQQLNKIPGVQYIAVTFRESATSGITFFDKNNTAFDRHVYLDREQAQSLSARLIADTLVLYKGHIILRQRGSFNKKSFNLFFNEQLPSKIKQVSAVATTE